MIRRLWDSLFRDVPVVFRSTLPPDECIRRLRQNTRRSIFAPTMRQFAAGPVDRGNVRLQRIRRWFGNDFKPIFVGKFEPDGLGTRLVGRFTVAMYVKVYMTIWLGIATLLTAFTALQTAAEIVVGSCDPNCMAPANILLPLFGVALFYLGIVSVKFGWFLSRGDMAYLSRVIESALED